MDLDVQLWPLVCWQARGIADHQQDENLHTNESNAWSDNKQSPYLLKTREITPCA